VEKKGLFEKIFGKVREPSSSTSFKLLNQYQPSFSMFGDNAYASDIVRASVHAIASSAGKLKASHVRRVKGEVFQQDSLVERMLTMKPNQYMNAYDFIYKVVTQLMMLNNSFIYVMRDELYNVTGFYPINSNYVELVEAQGELFIRFRFGTSKMIILPYEDIIHLRRFYYQNDIYGESNAEALYPTLELLSTTDQGIINAIKSSAYLRGLLKYTNQGTSADMKKYRDTFIADFMDVTNNGGIAALDSKADYVELKNDPKLINGPQMTLIEEKVYKYFGVNKNIIMADYTSSQWDAFYSTTIEPIALQLSLEFTNKLFSDRQVGYGNEIIFSASRLMHVDIKEKVSMAKELLPLGLMTINEMREIFEMDPVDGGDKRLMSLNYVNADKADQYQLGTAPVSKGDDPE